MIKRTLSLILLLAVALLSARDHGIKDGKFQIKNKAIDKAQSVFGKAYGGVTHDPEYDKSPNGYGWYQGYNRKIQLNSDPANPMIGSVYRKLNESTGSGTIGGMAGDWQTSTIDTYNELIFTWSPTYLQNPGGRYPYVCEFINGYLFGVYNDFDYNSAGEISAPMFSVGDMNFGYTVPMWSDATVVTSTESGGVIPGAWTGSGDVVYDPATGYYYWSQAWNENLVGLGDFVIDVVVGRSMIPGDGTSWEWTEYTDLRFDSSDDTQGVKDLNDISFAYCKDLEGNGTGYGIAVTMANNYDDWVTVADSTGTEVEVELNPRISYMYTTNWGADDSTGDWKPNWITDEGGQLFQLDPKDLFDWYGTAYTDNDTGDTLYVLNDPFITWNISSVATEENYVHVLVKVFGATYEGDLAGYLLYDNDEDLVLGYYHVLGHITDSGVKWSKAHLVGTPVGFELFDADGQSTSAIDFVYTNFNNLSIGYAGHGVVYTGWMDRPNSTRAKPNEWPEPDTEFWQDGFFAVSGDHGTTWDVEHKQVELFPIDEPGVMYNIYNAQNVTNTNTLHEEGWTVAARGHVLNDFVTVFATNQYFDVNNPLPDPVANFFDHQQFLKAWKVSGQMGVGIEADSFNMVKDFDLYQNYPNPFNPATEIRFALKNDSDVKLSIFNTKGEMVANLKDEKMVKGVHAVNFDASSLNSGVYFYKLEVGGQADTKKMVLTK